MGVIKIMSNPAIKSLQNPVKNFLLQQRLFFYNGIELFMRLKIFFDIYKN
jgi:hypothetical protein